MNALEGSKLFGYVAWGLVVSFSLFTLFLVFKLEKVTESLVSLPPA